MKSLAAKQRPYRVERYADGVWQYVCSCEYPGNAYDKASRARAEWNTRTRVVLGEETVNVLELK